MIKVLGEVVSYKYLTNINKNEQAIFKQHISVVVRNIKTNNTSTYVIKKHFFYYRIILEKGSIYGFTIKNGKIVKGQKIYNNLLDYNNKKEVPSPFSIFEVNYSNLVWFSLLLVASLLFLYLYLSEVL